MREKEGRGRRGYPCPVWGREEEGKVGGKEGHGRGNPVLSGQREGGGRRGKIPVQELQLPSPPLWTDRHL